MNEPIDEMEETFRRMRIINRAQIAVGIAALVCYSAAACSGVTALGVSGYAYLSQNKEEIKEYAIEKLEEMLEE